MQSYIAFGEYPFFELRVSEVLESVEGNASSQQVHQEEHILKVFHYDIVVGITGKPSNYSHSYSNRGTRNLIHSMMNSSVS
jgi:hypothetical protein